jgi:hypothetical protein
MAIRDEEQQGLNFAIHRAPQSVWDRRGWDGTREQLAMTRILLGVGGAALAAQGVRQHNWTGRALAAMGGTLAWWALTGEGDLSDVRCRFENLLRKALWHRSDTVADASADSFPASDAPSWTPTVGTGLRRQPSVGK